MKKALVTGATGQDASYLIEFLLDKGYEVHGIMRKSSLFNTQRIDHLYIDPHNPTRLKLHFGDLGESSLIDKLVREIKPDEVYNLGAMSHVGVSFEIPEYTANITGLGTLRLLESIRNYAPKAKFYQASSSEMFGDTKAKIQDENTPFYPRSPYGVAKAFSFWTTVNYREAFGIHASNGILFNHESPRRGRTFVTRKITRGLARIKLGKDKCLYLGNLEARRDWGHAKDYVEAMWLMLQQKQPGDYVIATGKTYSVRQFIEKTARYLGMKLTWKGKGLKEVGIVNGKEIVKIDPKYYRLAEVSYLRGDYSKAKKKLRWSPKYTFNQLVKEMAEFDYQNEQSNEFGF